MRNIEIDIERYLAENNLLKSKSFWKRFIVKAKEPGSVEWELWDFKESLPMWHVAGSAAQKHQRTVRDPISSGQELGHGNGAGRCRRVRRRGPSPLLLPVPLAGREIAVSGPAGFR